jgi:filamentous hemagglutinin
VDGVTTRNNIKVVAIRDPQNKKYYSPVSTFEKYFSGETVIPKSK